MKEWEVLLRGARLNVIRGAGFDRNGRLACSRWIMQGVSDGILRAKVMQVL